MVVQAMPASEPQVRRWTRDEFYKLLDLGMFEQFENRVELVEGEILVMSAQKNLHAFSVDNTHDALETVFAAGYWVRPQMSLDLTPYSVVDPDIAVVPDNYRSPTQPNPTTAFLVVEVSLTTLAYDQGRKASLYAAAAITDYWIVNLVDNQLEVYRAPGPDASARYGHSYADITILKPGDQVAPLALPHAKVHVAALMP